MTERHQQSSAGSARLLPCPFCGGEAGYYDCAPDNAAGVICNSCGLLEEPIRDATRAEARARWNTRVPAPAQPAMARKDAAAIATYIEELTLPNALLDLFLDRRDRGTIIAALKSYASQPSPAATVETDEEDDASYERGFKAGYEVATGQKGPLPSLSADIAGQLPAYVSNAAREAARDALADLETNTRFDNDTYTLAQHMMAFARTPGEPQAVVGWEFVSKDGEHGILTKNHEHAREWVRRGHEARPVVYSSQVSRPNRESGK